MICGFLLSQSWSKILGKPYVQSLVLLRRMPRVDLNNRMKMLLEFNPEKPDDQWKAAIALGNRRDTDSRVTVALIQALGGARAIVRAHSAEALGKVGTKEATEALIRALNDDYRLVRSYAARSLGQLGVDSAIPHLIERLKKDSYFGVRAEAAEALGRLCEGRYDEICQEVKKVLSSQRKKEEKKKSDRYIRVSREITDSLERLEEVLAHASKHVSELATAVDMIGDSSLSSTAKKARRALMIAERQVKQAKRKWGIVRGRPA